jgi:DNA-binding transcriptional regulator GbsR (MarR family)
MTATPSRDPKLSRLDLRVRQVCEAVGDFIEYWGFKSIQGKVWTLLALRRAPLAQTDIADFFDVSRSLVSSAVSQLVDYGLVRATGDHRNAPYEAVVDVWPTVSDVLRGREWMLIEAARVALDGAIEESEVSGAGAYDVDRMRFLASLSELAQAFLRLIIGLRVPRRLDGFGDWLKRAGRFMRELRSLR